MGSETMTLARFAQALGVSRSTAHRIVVANPGFAIPVLKNGAPSLWLVPKRHFERVIDGEPIEHVAASARAKYALSANDGATQ